MESPIRVDLCPSLIIETEFYPEISQGCCKSMYNTDIIALRMARRRDTWYKSVEFCLPC